MNILFNRTPSSKRWIVIITGLAWTLFARKGHASPLPAIPEQPELGTAISNTNSSSSDYDYYYTNHTDSQIRPRHLQLDSRGVGLKKGLIRAALWLNPDWVVLGFAYLEPEEGEISGDGSSVQLGALKLPAMNLDTTEIPRSRVYLLPKLGMQAQNPGNHYWTCLVYASKKNMKKVKPQMSYRFSHNHISTQAITFFSDPSFAGITVMQVPLSAKTVDDWKLVAECYKTPNKLPTKVNPSWNTWRNEIEGLPKGMNLV
ncbi:uncharacterized protein C8R40DRAFT_635762 [Lentinula edodes]|uniref:uncharacterized protein n=1 Tax=Lentinula edodes TaxID=5353 RepID=UPI001E8DAC48|nr:uncharacterized protein C8R40DRAFT_635762 [Lentinula edodes]KAH7870640.1 hypothetical protein C8R40DRAFT_635762 [Lentinula edodes]